ncbi:MAG TPA: M28 family peptidase [Vicinamibacterales bacterium]|nr:M28 family peptidase [Vicinamibacterales bacterium]
MRTSRFALALALVLALPRVAPAQSSPFLPDEVYRVLVNEISGDIAYEHIRWFTHYHRPMGGSEGYQAVEKYVADKAREYGLEDVRVIRLKQEGPSWSPRPSELWLIEPEQRRLAFSTEIPLSLADYSRNADVESAELVDVGEGSRAADYEGKDVKGKVVLASGPMARVFEEAVWNRGALGVISFSTGRMPDYPDQYPWARVPVENREKTKQGTWAFALQPREGERLRAQLLAAKAPFKVRAKVRSVFHPESYQSIVEAVIRGTEIHDQDIVLTGHLQEEMFSANDDASGCANVLEIGRALKKMIDEGTLPRPRRDIRFWWLDEISASEQYFADNPAETRQLLANINQDMVGAKQSAGSRVQFVTRPPFSRASFLGDVIESIVESLVHGNTGYLSAGQARQMRAGPDAPPATQTARAPFSRPILSRLGTDERYDARVIPFHNNTDHQVFNMGIVGVPGVTFTNWPDPFIHSSDDDLWQMDPTQLKRNAVAVAGTAWYLANTTDEAVPGAATEMYGRALERMSRDARTAMAMLACRDGKCRDAYPRAANLVRQAARRERRALETLARFTKPGGAGDRAVKAMLQQLPTEDNAEMRLAAYVAGVTGTKPSPSLALMTPREKELAGMVPAVSVSIQQYLDKRRQLKRPDSLHSLMAYEVMNFVDGTNSYLDIFRVVSAEADAAGDWYYGTVSPEDVADYLESARAAGIITVKNVATAKKVTDGKGGAR